MRSAHILGAVVAIAQVPGYAQPTRPRQPAWMLSPANAWMKVPVKWDPGADSISPALRFVRDQLYDQLIGDRYPLTPDTAPLAHQSATVGRPPAEIPIFQNEAVLIGTFTSYQPVLTASGRSVYTEVHFQVANVFKDPVGATAGSIITLLVNGGTVLTESGQILSYLTDAREYFVKPSKTYLLVLGYDPVMNAYRFGKDWDLSSGIVRADNIEDLIRARSGTSELLGLTIDQAIDVLTSKFSVK